MRKGDKDQMKRHRKSKHPGESPEWFQEQNIDPLAFSKFQALKEYNLRYERITEICRATTLAELGEPRGCTARTSSASPVKSVSLLLSAPSPPPQQQPAATTTDLRPSPAPFDQSPLSGSNHSITLRTANGASTHLLSLDGGGADGNAATPNELDDAAIADFVNEVLVPAAEKMCMRPTPQPSRASHDDLKQFIYQLNMAAQMGLTWLGRRHLTCECRSRRHPPPPPFFYRA